MLEDIAVLRTLGIKLENVTLAMLGRAKRVRIERRPPRSSTARVNAPISMGASAVTAALEVTMNSLNPSR
jgi:hypothetical protein